MEDKKSKYLSGFKPKIAPWELFVYNLLNEVSLVPYAYQRMHHPQLGVFSALVSYKILGLDITLSIEDQTVSVFKTNSPHEKDHNPAPVEINRFLSHFAQYVRMVGMKSLVR